MHIYKTTMRCVFKAGIIVCCSCFEKFNYLIIPVINLVSVSGQFYEQLMTVTKFTTASFTISE